MKELVICETWRPKPFSTILGPWQYESTRPFQGRDLLQLSLGTKQCKGDQQQTWLQMFVQH